MKRIFLICSFLLVLCGCQAQEEKSVVSGYSPKEAEIGVILPDTGNYQEIGRSARQGVEFALEEINKIGGVRGTILKAEFQDDKSDPAGTATCVNDLSDKNSVVALIGGFTDNTAFAGGIQANRRKITFITPAAGATGIPELGEYVFRNRISYTANATLLAEYLFQVAGKRVFAVLYPEDDYGVNTAEVFSRRVKELGGTVIVKESYAANSFSFSGGIAKIREGRPDVVFAPCYTSELIGISQEVYQQGLKTVLVGIESWSDDGKIAQGLNYLDGAIYTTSFYSDNHAQNVEEFVKNYKMKYGTPPDRIAAHCVDAVRLLAQSMYAGGFSRDSIRTELGRIKNFPGLTGKTSFGPGRDADKQVIFLTVNYGNIEKLK